MRRLTTLLVVLALTAAACASGEDAEPAADTVGVEMSSLRDGHGDAPARAVVAPEGSWAAAVPGTDAYLAVVSDGTQVMAYLCDSAAVSSWFTGDLTDADVTLTAADGTTLSTTLTDAGSLTVALQQPGGAPQTVELPAAENVLYRAEQVVPVGAEATSDDATGGELGEGAAEQPSDTSGGTDGEGGAAADPADGGEAALVLAGWVVLPDGTQRGSLLIKRFTSSSVTKVLSTTTTTKATTTTTKPPTTTTTLAAPNLQLAAGATAPAPVPVVEGAVTIVTLQPNPVTPQALGAGTPDRVREFVMVTLGDSFAAGEGAPNRAGDFDENGSLRDGGRREQWSQQPTGHPEVEACHRSDIAAGPLVAADLQAEFPDVRVIHQSFACSGAQIEHLLDTRYPGADNAVEVQVTPQLEQVRAWMDGTGPVRFPGSQKRIDAVYVNIGGNDFGFANVIASCIAPSNLPPFSCDRDTALLDEIRRIDGLIDGRYDRLAAALRSLSATEGGQTVSVAPAAIYLSQAPNPLHDHNGQFCAGLAGAPRGGRMGSDGGIANLSNLSREEAIWVEENVVDVLNAAIARQSDQFTIVTGIPLASLRHGICAEQPWINNIRDALLSQGKDLRADGVPALLSIFGALNLSSGMVHPNAAGYRGMADEILKVVRPQVRQTFTPTTPGRFRVGTVVRNGDIELRWDDTSGVETRFEIEEAILQGTTLVPFGTFTVDKNKQSVLVRLLGGPYTAQYRIRACNASACSAWSAPLGASNVPPVAPSNVTWAFERSSGGGDLGPDNRRLVASYTDNSRLTTQGGPASIVVAATPPGGGAVQQFIIQQPLSTTRTSAPATGGLRPPGVWSVALQACNGAGCSDPVGRRDVTVEP